MASGLDVLLGSESPQQTGLDVLLGGVPPMQSGSASPQVTNPTGGTLDNIAAGAGKFVSDTAQGSKQLLNDLAASAQQGLQGTTIGRALDLLNAKLGLQSPQDIQQQGRNDIAETRRLDAPLMATGSGKTGYALGGLATVPFLPASSGYTGAALLGAGMGATQPAESWGERAKNTAFGTGAALGGQAIANGLSRVIQPKTSDAASTLMNSGITPTPGQILGGGFKKAEEAMTSVPVVGDFIKAAQNRQIGQLNQAVANRALEPVGETLPAGVTGRDAIDYVGSTLGAKYDALLPKMSAQVDPQFAAQINNLSRIVNGGNMGQPEAQQFMSILKNNVLGKFQGQNAVTGETVKAMNSDLGRIASNYSRDPSFDKRQLGDAVGELQDAVRGLMTRQNPQYAPQLSAIDSGYAVFKRMQRAGSSLGAEDGVFNPSQLQNAVKAMDRSKDKGQFASGNALLQDLSDPAKALMAPKLNDSGTPYRSLLMAGAAGAAGHFVSPWAIPPALTAPMLYSPTGQRLAAALLASRPGFAGPLAQGAGLLATPMAAMAPALTYAQQQ